MHTLSDKQKEKKTALQRREVGKMLIGIFVLLFLVALIILAIIIFISRTNNEERRGGIRKELGETLAEIAEREALRRREKGEETSCNRQTATFGVKTTPVKFENKSIALPDTRVEMQEAEEKKDQEDWPEDRDVVSFTPGGWFLAFSAWIENTATYKEFYDVLQNATIENVCHFCGGQLGGVRYISLTNGWRIHKRCYGMISKTMSEVSSAKEARDLFSKSPKVLSVFHLVHTYWAEYPPDWDVRRRRVIRRAECACEDCGEQDEPLEVHHLRPIKEGGNHSLDNLTCLCRTCHMLYHNENVFERNQEGGRRSYYKYKIDLINQALNEKKDISFSYFSQKEEWTRRVASPIGWETRHGYQHIRAYCYLREEDRSFNVRRISRLRIG